MERTWQRIPEAARSALLFAGATQTMVSVELSGHTCHPQGGRGQKVKPNQAQRVLVNLPSWKRRVSSVS